MGLGTITAGISIALIFITRYFSVKSFVVKDVTKDFLFIYFIYSVLLTLLVLALTQYDKEPPDFVRYIVQFVLCLSLFGVNLTKLEHSFLKKVLCISMVVYSILIIRSCLLNPTRFYHDDIELFGVFLDPNYLGLPIVSAMLFLLHDFFFQKNKLIAGVMLFIMLTAIMYTASRGSMLAFLVGGFFVVINYIKKTKLSTSLIVMILIIMFAFPFLMEYLSTNFEQAFNRYGEIHDENLDNGRFDLWKAALEKWLDNPIWGYGVAAGPRVLGRPSHNTYIEVLLNTGIVGMIFYFSFMGQMIKKVRRLSLTFAIVFIAMLVQIAFLDSLNNRCVWVFLCWIAMLSKDSESGYYENNNN